MYSLKNFGKHLCLCLAVSLLSTTGEGLAATLAFDITSYPGITNWNALGLAVDPYNQNTFVTSLSYGGEDNLYKFSSDGTLLYSKRIDFASHGGTIVSTVGAVAVDSDNLYVRFYESTPNTNLGQYVAHLNGSGEILSSFSVGLDQNGIAYVASSNNFAFLDYVRNRDNQMIVEFDITGQSIKSFKLNDPYLSIDRAWTSGFSYHPIYDSFFTIYLNQTGLPKYDYCLAEYKLGNDGEYHVAGIYDLASAGLTRIPLAMDIDRSNGIFYVQENNSRILTFALTDLNRLSFPAAELPELHLIPEPEMSLLMLVGFIGLVAFSRGRK